MSPINHRPELPKVCGGEICLIKKLPLQTGNLLEPNVWRASVAESQRVEQLCYAWYEAGIPGLSPLSTCTSFEF